MSDEQKSGDSISANISGDVSGQVAVGKNIVQSQSVGSTQLAVTKADLAALQQILTDLKTKVEAEAPPEKKDAALKRVDLLKEAITEEEPDLDMMASVKKWFVKNIPALAGAVTSIVVHPIVGKLVEAGGDALVAEFKRRFSAG